jgi:5-methylcytosine-specific restriction endonuclease McrA
MKPKLVLVEVEENTNRILRIIRDKHEPFRAMYVDIMRRNDAVAAIRHQLFIRSKGFCDTCSAVVTEGSGHMHEQKSRGKGGEISLENSIFICASCHKYWHRERNPHFSRRKS